MGTPPSSQELTEGNAKRSQTRKGARGHAVAKGATRRRGDLECRRASGRVEPDEVTAGRHDAGGRDLRPRSEEHTSELQSRLHLVCRLLLEKKKKKPKIAER